MYKFFLAALVLFGCSNTVAVPSRKELASRNVMNQLSKEIEKLRLSELAVPGVKSVVIQEVTVSSSGEAGVTVILLKDKSSVDMARMVVFFRCDLLSNCRPVFGYTEPVEAPAELK